eukprot:6930428-Pyramimonas_sp.AAC.1
MSPARTRLQEHVRLRPRSCWKLRNSRGILLFSASGGTLILKSTISHQWSCWDVFGFRAMG